MDAALQRHGCRQGGPGSKLCAIWPPTLGEQNIRVNAISAGPIKTLAAAGIGDFRYILKWNEYNSPLRRTVTIDEVGDSACVSVVRSRPWASPVKCTHVDAGYHVVGMKNPKKHPTFLSPKTVID